jgi:outer membrane protein OmpA-like peptidoglycan-associated protein
MEIVMLGFRRSASRCAVAFSFAAALSLAGLSASATAAELTDEQIISSLKNISASAPEIDVAVLAQQALAAAGNPKASLPAWDKLASFPQLNVEINFEYDSTAVVPESYRALGSIADALHHPLLLGFKFLIVGHTDSAGKPDYNLKLSQKRADAIKEILSTTFAVPANRLYAVGVGEEIPIDAADPKAAVNRRVQLINIGVVK